MDVKKRERIFNLYKGFLHIFLSLKSILDLSF